MASTVPDVNLTKTKKLGKYSQVTESQAGNKRAHEKSRVLAAEEDNIQRKCAGCDKHMRKSKSPFACPCKRAVHCSKECLTSSKHRCEEQAHNEYDEANDVIEACDHRYKADRIANQGPSSEKIARLITITRADHRRILRYAETGNAIASYLVGVAYSERKFDRRDAFAIPVNYKEQSVSVTYEIAVKWLRVAAEGGVPEAMFLLFKLLVTDCGLWTDRRRALYWLDQAHATRNMDYVRQILDIPLGPCDFPAELNAMYNQVFKGGLTPEIILQDDTLVQMLMAMCPRELKAWNGKTAMGKPFYGWHYFNSIMESIGNLKNDQLKPSFIIGEKKKIVFISARPGFSDFTDKVRSFVREENNLKFVQCVKGKTSPDYQLVRQTSTVNGRTKYLITCKHDQGDLYFQKEGRRIKIAKYNGVSWIVNKPLMDGCKRYKSAGECESCVEEAKQRLRAVSSGLFSMSLTPVYGYGYYAARYANDGGVIVQDVFLAYSKPYIRQALQCLMNNPHDLHPLAVADVQNLFWPIIWFWGSVYEAIEDSCNKTTLDTIYRSLGDNVTCGRSQNASSMAASSVASSMAGRSQNASSMAASSVASSMAGRSQNASSVAGRSQNASSVAVASSVTASSMAGRSQNASSMAGRSQNASSVAGRSQNASSVAVASSATASSATASSMAGRSQNASSMAGRSQNASSVTGRSQNASSVAVASSATASSMAAFPDGAAGEWRIACGNEDCPRLDHEVKFNLCEGCKVRRYCDTACQRKDWPKHKKFCKAGKKEGK